MSTGENKRSPNSVDASIANLDLGEREAAAVGSGIDEGLITEPVTPIAGKTDRSGSAATVVGAGILVSRLSGLARQWVFAKYFGLGMEGDAYSSAMKIPNTMRSLLGEGAMSASFVPVYTRLLAKGDERGANALAGAVLGLLMAAVSVLTLVGILAAEPLTTLLASGFVGEKRELTITLTRIMFPMTAFMVLSGWCLGVQNSHRRFFWSYASAAMWNVAQIALLLWAGPTSPPPFQLATWLAWATLGGSVLQVTVQMPEVLRLVRPFRVSFDRSIAGVRETLGNVVPVITALGVVQLSSFIDLQIATYLPDGALTSLGNANTVVQLPVALFGISVAASSLPEFSRDSDNSMVNSALLERLRGGWQRILFYVVPSTIACIVYGDLIVGLLFRTGKFGREQQQVVHSVLAAFAIGLVSFGSVKLLSSAHYALKDYRTPLRASIGSLAISAIISIAFAWPMRHTIYGAAGIALGTAIGSYVNLSVQIRGLRAKLGKLYTPHMWAGTRRIVVATVGATMLAAPLRYTLGSDRPWIAAPPTLAVFLLGYLVIAWLMGSGEAARWLRRPVRALPGGS